MDIQKRHEKETYKRDLLTLNHRISAPKRLSNIEKSPSNLQERHTKETYKRDLQTLNQISALLKHHTHVHRDCALWEWHLEMRKRDLPKRPTDFLPHFSAAGVQSPTPYDRSCCHSHRSGSHQSLAASSRQNVESLLLLGVAAFAVLSAISSRCTWWYIYIRIYIHLQMYVLCITFW